MDSIRRLLGEDEVAPVMVPSTTLLDRQRRARPWFREDPPASRESEGSGSKPTKESLVDSLNEVSKWIRESQAGDLFPVADRLDKLVEGINKNAFVAFDATMSVTTVRDPNVVTQPRPPEQDPVIAAILAKEPPQSSTQSSLQTPNVHAQNPTPANIQKAMEDAALGKEAPPKITLVESAGAATAASLLQTGGSSMSGGPLLGAPPSGDTTKTWNAFMRFVKAK